MPSECSHGHVRCLHGVLQFWDFIEHRGGVVENWGFVSDGGRWFCCWQDCLRPCFSGTVIKRMPTLNPLDSPVSISDHQWYWCLEGVSLPSLNSCVCPWLGMLCPCPGFPWTLWLCAPEGPAFLSLSGSPHHPLLPLCAWSSRPGLLGGWGSR